MLNSRLPRFWWVFLLLLGGCKKPDFVRWTLINVNGGETQAEANLIEFPGGKRALIDVGNDDDRVLHFLRARDVRTVDWVFITHAHKDHYGGLARLIEGGIELKEVRFNLPSHAVCSSEGTWGCDFAHVGETVRRVSGAAPIVPLQVGQAVGGGGGELKVLYAFDGVETPVGSTDVNDMSAVMLLTFGNTRVLFTGDLNQKIGTYLAEHGENLSAEILKVPHHGADSLAPDIFFDKVGFRVALIPATRGIWNGDRGKRTREYMKAHGVTTYVNAFHGDIAVRLRREGFSVLPQFNP